MRSISECDDDGVGTLLTTFGLRERVEMVNGLFIFDFFIGDFFVSPLFIADEMRLRNWIRGNHDFDILPFPQNG